MKIEKKKKKTLKNIGQVDYTVIDTVYCMDDSFSQTLKVFTFKYSLFTEKKRIKPLLDEIDFLGKKLRFSGNLDEYDKILEYRHFSSTKYTHSL